MRRYLVPLIFGLGGCAVLASLGLWQVQRLAWKESVLAEIDARIGTAPVAVPDVIDPVADKYLPVVAEGAFGASTLRVLVSSKGQGAGYRLVTGFTLEDGRRVMVDEGFVRAGETPIPEAVSGARVVGNLHWPDEQDSWTPEPDMSEGLFYARDVDQMAAALGAEPVLIVARTVSGVDARATPMPVTSAGIPNNHLGYAVQWFGLASVWLGMTAFLLWRIRKQSV